MAQVYKKTGSLDAGASGSATLSGAQRAGGTYSVKLSVQVDSGTADFYVDAALADGTFTGNGDNLMSSTGVGSEIFYFGGFVNDLIQLRYANASAGAGAIVSYRMEIREGA